MWKRYLMFVQKWTLMLRVWTLNQAFSPDKKWLAVNLDHFAGARGGVVTWDLRENAQDHVWDQGAAAGPFHWPAEDHLCCLGYDGPIAHAGTTYWLQTWRRRPLLTRPEIWFAVLLFPALVWSIRRDRKTIPTGFG